MHVCKELGSCRYTLYRCGYIGTLDTDRAELDPLRGQERQEARQREEEKRVEGWSVCVCVRRRNLYVLSCGKDQRDLRGNETGDVVDIVGAVRRHSRVSEFHSLNDWRLSSPRGSNLIREFWLVTSVTPLDPLARIPPRACAYLHKYMGVLRLRDEVRKRLRELVYDHVCIYNTCARIYDERFYRGVSFKNGATGITAEWPRRLSPGNLVSLRSPLLADDARRTLKNDFESVIAAENDDPRLLCDTVRVCVASDKLDRAAFKPRLNDYEINVYSVIFITEQHFYIPEQTKEYKF